MHYDAMSIPEILSNWELFFKLTLSNERGLTKGMKFDITS